MTADRRDVFTPYPYGMCETDADLYDDDVEPGELAHAQCIAAAQHRDDEVLAWLLECEQARKEGER